MAATVDVHMDALKNNQCIMCQSRLKSMVAIQDAAGRSQGRMQKNGRDVAVRLIAEGRKLRTARVER